MEHPRMIITPQIRDCNSFIDETGKPSTVTVVIVPFRISPLRDGYTIAWGCNFADTCKFEKCYYSKESRKLREQKRGERGWPD